MARFEGGWFKTYRSALFGDIGKDFLCFGILNALVGMATRYKTTVRWNGQPREVGPGHVVCSLRGLAMSGNITVGSLRRRLKYLESRGTITIQSSKEGTLIKVNNYKQYQEHDASVQTTPHTPTEHKRNNRGHNAAHSPGPPIEEEAKEERNNNIILVQNSESKESKPVQRKRRTKYDKKLLEELYWLYPKHQKKSKAIPKLETIIKTDEDYERVKKSILAYNAFCKKEEKSKQYIMLMTTFLGEWTDWLDKANGSCSIDHTENEESLREYMERTERERKQLNGVRP